ncbi:hypothetical protein OEZ85_007009 [Tetradesmus obliquus]|uniref:Vacuolar protein 14 C-terminal Fig4-binding domain-containing protein n=1 Tax=Tetradesmus obliquus TaxID=3088 RepID=A0ABY8TX37_TETOB|nr:hypothetical protein OEZ85_007009 [Tetradesmus obliquus]
MVAMEELLPQAVLRQIGDKLYEKRKVAALEVEQIVKRLAAVGDTAKISAILDKLIAEYAFSAQANHRKGALLCLAAAAVGLGEPSEAYLRQIVPPVLASFTDQDSRVRYYACEALYNIAKVARDNFIVFFSEVFDAMFRLCADSETNVQNAVQFLDNLVKDIVTASPHFSVEGFIPRLRDYLRVTNPYKRQFLISWVSVLDSVPDLDMLAYLPQLLDGLMNLLSDPNREIRVAAHKCMMEFLVEIQATPTVDWVALASILVEKASSQDEFTRITAIKWIKEFVEQASGALVGLYAELIGAVLPNISHPNPDIQQVSKEANAALLNLQPYAEQAVKVEVGPVLAIISRELRSEQEPTRLEALRWIHFLLVRNEDEVFGQLAVLLAALLDALASDSERVVLQALSVLGAIAGHAQHFRRVLMSLLDRFRGDAGLVLLQRGGPLVIRRLCAAMGPEVVFREFASILDGEEDLGFASTMVQALNLILLTAGEVRELRDTLRDAAGSSSGSTNFKALYSCWSHSAGALLSLCLLAQVYSHCCDIIQHLATLPLGAEVLVQIDRLVQLLETPAFAFLRLQLLQPSRHPDLLRALYGLLMLLPQSSAFKTLSARLQAVPAVTLMQLEALQLQQQGTGSKGGKQQQQQQQQQLEQQQWADFDDLLKNFVARQQQHAAEEERRRLLVEGLRVEEDIQKEQQHQASMAAVERSSPTSSGVVGGGGDDQVAAAAAVGSRES